MKKLHNLQNYFLLLLLAMGLNLKAQNVRTEYADKINEVFAGVDLSRVPHHLLTDYAMEFVDLKAYNGVENDSNYVSKGIYRSAYNTLLMARTQTNVADLIRPNQFYNNWQDKREAYTIALSGLYYKYSSFREDAHPDYITISDNKLYDKYVDGVWQNPYETHQVFMMAPPITRYNYKNMVVELPENLWYSNQDVQVQSIAIDFNDGNGYQTINFRESINLTYESEGIYDWDYKLTLTNGENLFSHSKIIIGDNVASLTQAKRLPTDPCDPANPNDLEYDEIAFQGTQQFDGKANSATIQIEYAGDSFCGDITKPLIVAEGFDTGLSGDEEPLGADNMDEFLTQIRIPSVSLRGEIDTYDIIYINWDQGRDDLRRNALLLEEIITWVNDEKVDGAEQNVVLGQSMGGVLARYALANMEEESDLDHDTRLYISHDAPHQGANIPIGIQFFARHIANEFIDTPAGGAEISAGTGGSASIEEINNLFNQPGTQQLLSTYVDSSLNIDNTAFDDWQTELQSKGYPTQTRNIAISNGSFCGNPQDYDYNASLFKIDGKANSGLIVDILGLFFGVVDDIALAMLFEEPALLLGILPGGSKYDINFNAKALPQANSSANVYSGKIEYTKTLIWLIPITVSITDLSANAYANLSFDVYPGGRNDLFDTLNDIVYFDDIDYNENGEADYTQFQADMLNFFAGSVDIDFENEEAFGFIPSVSALDVGGGNSSLDDNDYFKIYNAENPPTGGLSIPFHNFISAYFDNNSNNERHISFNFRNGDWLATELDTIINNEEIFDCSNLCNGNIQGSSLVCSESDFTITGQTNSVSWSIEPSNAGTINVDPNNQNNITLTRNTNFSDTAVLKASVSTEKCGSGEITKELKFGIPTQSTPVSLSGPDELNPGQQGTYSYSISSFNNASNFEWVLFSNIFPNAEQHFELNVISNSTFSVKPDFDVPAGNYTVQARVGNGCGFYPISKTIYVYEGDGTPVLYSASNLYKIYPNPSSTYFNISLVDKNLQPINTNGIYGELLDMNGLMKKNVNIKNNQAKVNASNLRKGVYILRIHYDGKTEGHQVIVE